MSLYPRYALYYVPDQESRFYRFGAQVLGYDAFTARDIAFPPELPRPHADWPELTSDPRRYGFHATLKAPFSLRPGKTETDVIVAAQQFAEQHRIIPVIVPVVRTLCSFVAIVPSQRNAALNDLARDCVVAFDPFRAPLSPQDRARRNSVALTPKQRDHLDSWGYPYVMDDFRFHMTLTGSLPRESRDVIAAMLHQGFSALNVTRLPIDKIAIFKQQDGLSQFGIIATFDLKKRTRS